MAEREGYCRAAKLESSEQATQQLDGTLAYGGGGQQPRAEAATAGERRSSASARMAYSSAQRYERLVREGRRMRAAARAARDCRCCHRRLAAVMRSLSAAINTGKKSIR